jgi:hypothetical protein
MTALGGGVKRLKGLKYASVKTVTLECRRFVT